MVSREGVANAQLAHGGETDAIGERPFVVRVFAEEGGGSVESLRTNPLQAEPLGLARPAMARNGSLPGFAGDGASIGSRRAAGLPRYESRNRSPLATRRNTPWAS